MMDWLAETPRVVPDACPACRPDLDYAKEFQPSWCDAHIPSLAGSEDRSAASVSEMFLSGHAEAGGTDNRILCNLIHRPQTMDAPCD